MSGSAPVGATSGASAAGNGAAPTAADHRLRQACADFEGLFLSQLFAQMRQTVPHDGMLDGGQGEDMFTSMMDEHVAGAAATRMQHGLGAALYRQLHALLHSGAGYDAATAGSGSGAAPGGLPGAAAPPAPEGS